MSEDISLLPKEVEKKREAEARSRLLRRVSFVFLAFAIFFGLGVFVYSSALKSQLSRLEKAVGGEKSKVSSLSGIELKAQDLDARVRALQDIFANRAYFSNLLATLSRRVPPDVSLREMTVPSEELVSVSGVSRSYASLAAFLLNLKELDDEAKFFDTVELRSVSLDQQTGEVNFDLNLKIAKGALKQ